MSKSNEELIALWLTDEPEAVRRCQAALTAHGGHRAKAAKQLRVSLRQLYRWLAAHPAILRGIRGLRTNRKPVSVTIAQVKDIRNRVRVRGESAAAVARDYGLTRSAVSRICNGSRRA